jgi:hypothetical protein
LGDADNDRGPSAVCRGNDGLVGILLEERDLVDVFGDDYRRYRERVSMLVPWRKSV